MAVAGDCHFEADRGCFRTGQILNVVHLVGLLTIYNRLQTIHHLYINSWTHLISFGSVPNHLRTSRDLAQVGLSKPSQQTAEA
jgi:hypothetical protein